MLKCLSVDSSLRNCGFFLTEVEETLLENPKTQYYYENFKTINYGTFVQDDARQPLHSRLFKQAKAVHTLIALNKPDIFILEDSLNVGLSKSVTGLTLCSLILNPLHPDGENFVGLLSVKCVVLLSPIRLQVLAHREKKTAGSVVVKKYKSITGDVSRITEHAADAWFATIYGVRFYQTCVQKVWPQSILDDVEKRIFLDSTTQLKQRVKGKKGLQKIPGQFKANSLFSQENICWWKL